MTIRATRMPTVVDLFSGAGLLSYAFRMEGFDVVKAVEADAAAASTYAANVGAHVVVADVRRIIPEGQCDVLVAGPPCQGFSTLGKRDASDPRNALSLEVVRWAKLMRPKVVVIENVAAFLESSVCNRVTETLGDMGYSVSAGVFNAAEYGVPQVRIRSFTFAFKTRIPVVKKRRVGQPMTVREAWSGIPLVPTNQNLHFAPSPSPLALARMKVIPSGGDKRDVMRRAPRLAAPSWWRLPSDITDVWGRMEWDKPSNTLRTALQNPSKGRYIHPEQHRVISLREACRLHTIPDQWVFKGWPTWIARQIGNSVPPALGRAVANAVRAVI